ncbi:hypothetical protein Ddc_05741 [Ditylenchus destructor]|nr:hypothetical protein Ddc_05741 [Ditylenchus destructor]
MGINLWRNCPMKAGRQWKQEIHLDAFSRPITDSRVERASGCACCNTTIPGRVIVDRVVYARRKAEVILFLFGDSSLRTNQLAAGGGCAENQTIIHNLQQQIIQSYPLSR